jgi:uncharacterized SAM-binding protein YcdF (DUF218 family)
MAKPSKVKTPLSAQTAQKSQRYFKKRMAVLVGLMAFGLGYKLTRHNLTPPQALLVLGGEPKREQFAAQFARQYPTIPIWVSSGSNREYAEWVFAQAGIDRKRIHLDYHAVDTVTNFTTLVGKLQKHQITAVYLITSDDHMLRSRIVGEIILGSRGIEVRPVSFPSGREPESIEKVVRDSARALLWVLTGKTGAKANV